MLKQAIIVALGGALGSVARYKVGGFVLHHTESWNFPASTFCVNLLGCFAKLDVNEEIECVSSCPSHFRRWKVSSGF